MHARADGGGDQRRLGRRPARNIRNTVVAKNSGYTIASRPSKADRLRIFSCSHQVTDDAGASDPHAPTHQLDVGVLQRRLAGGDPPTRTPPRQRRAPAWVTSAPGSARTSSSCGLAALLDRHRAHAGQRAHRADGAVGRRRRPRPRRRLPSPTRCLSSVGRALGDDAAAGDHRDPVAELVGLEHVVRGQQHRRALLDQVRDGLRAARGRRPGRCRCSARRGTAPRGGAAGRGRCAGAGACRASSPRPAPSRGRSGRRAPAARRCARAARAAGTPYSSAK